MSIGIVLADSWSTLIERELDRVLRLGDGLTERYLKWPDHVEYGEVHNTLYGEMLDYVNFRVETAQTVRGLVSDLRVADGLALSRTLLEHYLLLRLMVRGYRYFKLRDLTDLTVKEFEAELAAEQEKYSEARAAGNTPVLDVGKYPRARRHIMYVLEGLKAADDPKGDFKIPPHYFRFRDFHPETMRLRPEDYFEYYEPEDDVKGVRRRHRAEAALVYRHYLSYDALLECLALNSLADEASLKRIDAHYTYLGRFVHPTHEAARDLHEHGNVYSGRPHIGLGGNYSVESRLLAALYAVFLLSGVLDEIATLFESAPRTYILSPGTTEIRTAIAEVESSIQYFWFLFNEASLHDKYIWAIHHATDEQLDEHGGYAGLPSELVSFNHDIYGSFQTGLMGWNNRRCGSYRPPIEGF